MTGKTPIALITGSLGSGKTTLLQKILDTTERRLAILMNEFGEIGIDSQVLQGKNVRVIELAGGCVCCELSGELEAAVVEIIERFHPEYIVLEATGVAEADALAYEVEDNLPQVRLDSVICIVDAYASTKYPEVGYAARSQLQEADILLINKIDLVSSEEVEKVVRQVQKYSKTSSIFKTVRCDIDTTILLGLDVNHHIPSGDHHHKHDFQSFSFTTDGMLEGAKFQELISELSYPVYRAKGFVRLDTGGYLFNYVAGRANLEEAEVVRTQLVFIGPHLLKAQEDILARLRNCKL